MIVSQLLTEEEWLLSTIVARILRRQAPCFRVTTDPATRPQQRMIKTSEAFRGTYMHLSRAPFLG